VAEKVLARRFQVQRRDEGPGHRDDLSVDRSRMALKGSVARPILAPWSGMGALLRVEEAVGRGAISDGRAERRRGRLAAH
jgi:hypothetical protein